MVRGRPGPGGVAGVGVRLLAAVQSFGNLAASAIAGQNAAIGLCGDPGEPECFTLRLPGGDAVGSATTSGVVVAPAGGLPWWLLVAIVGAGGLLAAMTTPVGLALPEPDHGPAEGLAFAPGDPVIDNVPGSASTPC